MRELFICKTPYQILAATRICMEQYPPLSADMIVFDTIANAEVLVANLQKSGIFQTVSLYRHKKYDRASNLKRWFYPLLFRRRYKTETHYDHIYYANIYDWETNNIIRGAAHRAGTRPSVFMYEDGFSTYVKHHGAFFDRITSSRGFLRAYYKYLYGYFFHMAGLYVFTPELVEWKPEFPIFGIRKITDEDSEYRNAVNRIFGYASMTDVYQSNYIFFEESYYADHIAVEDIQVVNAIAQCVGKDNMMVKIHPRNPVNRFRQLGYQTNENTEIPWEVIAMNIDIRDKILLTIASGSALTSLANLCSRPRKIIMLMNCKEIDQNKLTPTLPMLRKIAGNYKESVLLPASVGEAKYFCSCEETL